MLQSTLRLGQSGVRPLEEAWWVHTGIAVFYLVAAGGR
jgi:hypothetical protein